MYPPLSFIGKIFSDYGLLSKMKSNLEDLYLNIKQCILILLKNYTIWSHNLVLLLLKKRTLLSKIPAVSAHESKSSAAVPNFGRGFSFVNQEWEEARPGGAPLALPTQFSISETTTWFYFWQDHFWRRKWKDEQIEEWCEFKYKMNIDSFRFGKQSQI